MSSDHLGLWLMWVHLTFTLGLLETSNFACAKFHANKINKLFCTHLHCSVDLAHVMCSIYKTGLSCTWHAQVQKKETHCATGTSKWPEPSGVRTGGILRYENTLLRVVPARDLKTEWLNGWILWIVLLYSFFNSCVARKVLRLLTPVKSWLYEAWRLMNFLAYIVTQVLCFDAYFQEAVHEKREEQYRIRRFAIFPLLSTRLSKI